MLSRKNVSILAVLKVTPEQIELGIMPAIEEQQPYLSVFPRRVTEVLKDAARYQQPISIIEAEQMVWKQIETVLLTIALPYEV